MKRRSALLGLIGLGALTSVAQAAPAAAATTPIELGPKVSGSGNQFRIPMPAKTAGDYIQFVLKASEKPTSGLSDSELVAQYGSDVYVYHRYVNTTSGATTVANGLLVKFSKGVGYEAQAMVLHVAGSSNPNQPGGNEALRQALLGAATGAVSGLPFNDAANVAGRNGRFGSPDGYEYLNDVAETQRGVPFDFRAGFQYQNKNITDSGAWNDLIGFQTLDWWDDTKTAVVGMNPFPRGGSWTDAAAGAYDAQYVAIGQTIAAKRPAGKGKVVVRLAWEFNGINPNGTGWFYHVGVNQNGTPKAGFLDGWRRAVTKLREGAGDRIVISWCPAMSTNSQAQLEALYPGDGYVDVVAGDTYDAWVNAPGGFQTQAAWLSQTGVGALFAWAKARGKLFALDEWGGHDTGEGNDGGDNPQFQTIVYGWAAANADDLAYLCQFNDSNVHNNLWSTGGVPVHLPNARARQIQIVQGLSQ